MTLQRKHHRHMLRNMLTATAVWCGSLVAGAAELQPFTADSMAAIEARYTGQPFVVGLWSLTCPPCLHELETLHDWQTRNPAVPVILIATDDQDQAGSVKQVLQDAGLSTADNWLFADPFVEKLRFKIDANWRGELPRSYLYMTSGERHAISGALTTETLEKWHAHVKAASVTTPNESKQ